MKINHLFLIFSAIFITSCGGGGGSGSDSGHARIYDWDSSAGPNEVPTSMARPRETTVVFK